MLTLNTTEMVHGAFGLEGETVVIIHALELENLDLNEFQAVVDDMSHGRRETSPLPVTIPCSAHAGAVAG